MKAIRTRQHTFNFENRNFSTYPLRGNSWFKKKKKKENPRSCKQSLSVKSLVSLLEQSLWQARHEGGRKL